MDFCCREIPVWNGAHADKTAQHSTGHTHRRPTFLHLNITNNYSITCHITLYQNHYNYSPHVNLYTKTKSSTTVHPKSKTLTAGTSTGSRSENGLVQPVTVQVLIRSISCLDFLNKTINIFFSNQRNSATTPPGT